MAGDLDAEEVSAVESHVDTCRRCQEQLARISQAPHTFQHAISALGSVGGQRSDSPSDDATDWLAAMARRIAGAVVGDFAQDEHASSVQPPWPLALPGCELRGILGRGGMGTVYLAWQQHMQRFVAVKVLPPAIAADSQARARFAREVAALAKLKHPAIVTAYEAGELEGTSFLLMEYVRGETLSSLARRLQTVPFADACEMTRQASLGIQYAHDQGLVHRDIKPSNLMLNDRGEVRILDLGLARFVAGEDDHELTVTGQLMGTIDYMAPEQIDNSREVTSQADVYSLGATLYRLLTGSKPLAVHGSPLQKLAAVALGDVPLLEAGRHHVPPALVPVVHRAMQRDCESRYATAVEFADALSPFCAGANLAALVECQEPLTYLRLPEADADRPFDPHSHSTDSSSSETYRHPVPIRERTEVPSGERPGKHDLAKIPPRSRRAVVVLGIAFSLFLLAAIYLRMSDGGYLKIESLDPELKVEVLRSNQSVDQFAVGQRDDYTWYRSGEYEVRIVGQADDALQLEQSTFQLRRNGKHVVRIRRVEGEAAESMDDPSVAPFDPLPKTLWSFQKAPLHGPGGLVFQPFARQGLNTWQIYTKNPRNAISEMSWSPDGRYVAASVYSENTVRVYDTSTWELAFILPLRDVATIIDRGEMSWSHDGRFLAALNQHMLSLWDLSSRRARVLNVQLVDRVAQLRWHPSKNVVAAATDYRVVLVDPATGDLADVCSPEFVTRIEWAPAGDRFLVVSDRPLETQVFHYTATAEPSLQTTHEFSLPSNVVAIDSGSPRFAWLDDQDQIQVATWQQEKLGAIPSPASGVKEIFFGPNDRIVWLAGETRVVHTRLGSRQQIEATINGPANMVDWLSEDRILVSGDPFYAEPVRIVDGEGKVVIVPHAHKSPIFSPDRQKLISLWPHTRSTWRGSLQAVRGDGLELVVDMSRTDRSPTAASWQPDGTHYTIGHGATILFTHPQESLDNPEANGRIELYDDTGELVRTIARPAVVPASLLWNADDQTFMAGCRDGTIRTWSRSGVLQRVQTAHETTVTDLDRHPNGELLVSASSRGGVKVWHGDGKVEEVFAADLEQQMKVEAKFRPRLGDHLLVTRKQGWLIEYPRTDQRQKLDQCERATWIFDGSQLVTLSSDAANFLTMPHRRLFGTPIDDREFSAIAASSTSEEVLVGGMFSMRRCNSHTSAASPVYRQAYGKASIRSIDYAPDDQQIAAISTYLPGEGPLFPVCWLWSANNQPDDVPLEAYRLFGNLSTVRFSNHGDTLLAAGDPGIVMWDLATHSLVMVVVPLPDGQSVTLGPDGQILHRTPQALEHLYHVVEHGDGTLETREVRE